MTDAFPSRLRCSSENWHLQNAARSGGQTLAGAQQFVSSPSSQWRAKMTFHLLDDDDYLEARGFIAGLAGQTVPFMVGPYDYRGQPWNVFPITGRPITPDVASRSAEVGQAYTTNAETTGTTYFTLAAAAPLNSTTLSVTRTKGGVLKRGQYLSIRERLHIIVNQPADPGTAGPVQLSVRPWLRHDYSAGEVVNFASPQCLMRLADGDTGAVDMTSSPLSDISLDLIEAF